MKRIYEIVLDKQLSKIYKDDQIYKWYYDHKHTITINGTHDLGINKYKTKK